MDMNTIIGVFALAFGLVVHFIGYTVLPLLLGGWILYKTYGFGHF